jgi:hypothetical protein
MDCEQTRLTFDHDVADVGEGFTHQRYSWWCPATPLRGAGRKARLCIIATGDGPYPFRTGARFAGTATAKK